MAVTVVLKKKAPPPPPDPKKRRENDEDDGGDESASALGDVREALVNATEWIGVAYERLDEIEEEDE